MAAYALTIFLGAFLLFQVQPLIGKFVLPWFGGGPGVWTTCMLFFQLLLVGGYGYAHWVSRHLRPRSQAILHTILMAAALFTLPIIPSDMWKPLPGSDPTGRILLLLTACVGLPYFILSTTGPLMQHWFSLSQPGKSPYRLYALSNIGSLLALLSYPFVFEPMLTRRMQAYSWSAGLGVFALCAGYCAWRLAKTQAPATVAGDAVSEADGAGEKPSFTRRLLWLFLPACASAFLLATTNKICQDVAVIPFLWVLPLALYLITFIISFDNSRWYVRPVFGLLYIIGLVGISFVLYRKHEVSLFGQLTSYSAVLFICCMVCHGELYRLKPHPRHLTEYYFMISVGGALGGIFVALIAPYLFVDYYEFQFGLLACGVALLMAIYHEPVAPERRLRRLREATILFSAILIEAIALHQEVHHSRKDAVSGSRNFYGVLTVFEYNKEDPTSHYYMLQHGRITHGIQFTDNEGRRMITTYYAPNSGVGLAVRQFPRQQGQRIGVVGLGTGSMIAYAKPGDYFRIYEINPDVRRLATSRFTYVHDAPAQVDIIMGDARLSMEREPSQQFDVLVLDAFSSDAIPVHLLTREAFEIYRRHLKPDGVIAVHVSNRHLDLRPVVLNIADQFKMQTAIIENEDGSDDGSDNWWIYASTWVLVTDNKDFIEKDAVMSAIKDYDVNVKNSPLWTDDYSALFRVLQK